MILKLTKITRVVQQKFGTQFEDVFLKSRKRPLCLVRQTSIAIAWMSGVGSLKEIGRQVECHHTTVYNCAKVVRDYYATDKQFRAKFDSVCEELGIDLKDKL
jgi:chromosomal replication initiation ATPase DnaA